MTATYDCIATTTLGSNSATVTFSSISGTYTDLVLVMNTIGTITGGDVQVRFNSDTGSNYSVTVLYGTGITAGAFRQSNQTSILLDYYAELTTGVSNRIVSIQNYANTTTYKTLLGRANNAGNGVDAVTGLWRSTSAITTIGLQLNNANNFATGSTFTLYGIKAE